MTPVARLLGTALRCPFVLLFCAASQAQDVPSAASLPPVEVVGTTILPGIGTPLKQVPANVQVLDQREFEGRRALDLSDALARSAASVNLNDTTGNPFQHDVNFRGFTASPQLGTPQGLSVFVDGVRVNETFGDTVNWDLIPNGAIASVTVIPGSNPAFGLNTLGGALNVTTKSGRTDPGTSISLTSGSYGRKVVEFETGGQSGHFDFFVTGNSLRESGWGDHDPSRVQQLFAKVGVHEAAYDVDLSVTLADNRLEGNQTLPLSLADDFRRAYSWPDYQTNRLAFVNLKAAHHFTDDLVLEADAYYRKLETGVLNSNVNNNFDPTADVGPGNQPTGNAINQIDQSRPGASVQLTSVSPLAGHASHLIVGASVDGGRTSFAQSTQAVGLAWSPNASLTAYASYNEGMRVPTPVELTCADPNAPCSLPNAFSSDPALKPVVSKTVELGLRGRVALGLGWSAAVFRTGAQDDIQFISSGGGATSSGYFQNVGRTRRQGLELGLDGRLDTVSFSAHYSYVAATFQSPLVLNSPNNSTAAALSCETCSDIRVEPGDRMPGVPKHILKLRGEWELGPGSIGANLLAQSSQLARGDENNQDANGPVPGFAVINLDARWRFAPRWELFANIDNVFDRRFSTFGTLGQNVFTGPGGSFDATGSTWRNEQFRSFGAPRGVWVGLTYRFGEAVE